ncbi:MAG TPA: hypothetical protein VN864_01080 [Thermoplasmata archaeon]|nr:hypothetical protein [Thermoplasmata archaeon]
MSRGHRFGAVRSGPILPPRRLDGDPPRPEGARTFRAVGLAPPAESGAECAEIATAAGWTLAAVRADREGRTTLVAERAVRMDLSALGRNRLFLAACTAEYVAAISLGFIVPSFGVPGWEGEILIALGVVGAVGFVALLPRVEFWSQVAVVRFVPPDRRTEASPSPRAGPEGPFYEAWAVEARSRNWEVLGDRGGRRILATVPSPDADSGAQRLAVRFAAGRASEGRQNPPDGFK